MNDAKEHIHKLGNNMTWNCWIFASIGAIENFLTKVTKCLYEGVIVPTALHGAEVWGMTSPERRKVNVPEMCLRSLFGLSRMDRIRNEEELERKGVNE